jgi:hypothetical protein
MGDKIFQGGLGTPQLNTDYTDLTEQKFYTAIEGVSSNSQVNLLPTQGLINQLNAIQLAAEMEEKKKFEKAGITNLSINDILQNFTNNFFRLLDFTLNYNYSNFTFKTFLTPFFESENLVYTGVLFLLLYIIFSTMST